MTYLAVTVLPAFYQIYFGAELTTICVISLCMFLSVSLNILSGLHINY